MGLIVVRSRFACEVKQFKWQVTISLWIFVEVVLMIFFGSVEVVERFDFYGNGLAELSSDIVAFLSDCGQL